MDLKRLKYFCAIVEHGQISKAAQVLNMAQPPLSQRLKELEAEFGVELIKRGGGRHCEVTEAGRRLYEKARFVLSEIDGLTDELKSVDDSLSYVVIGVSSTCASYLRKPLQHVCRAHPNIKMRVLLGDSSWLETMLRQRCIDMAIMQAPEDEKALVVDRLPVSCFLAVVPNAIIQSDWPDALTLEHIAPHPLLLLRRSSGVGIYEKIIRLFHRRGLSPNLAMDCVDVRVLRDLWTADMGAVALLPASEMADYQPMDGRGFFLDEPEIVFSPVIARLESHYLNKGARLVIDQILAGVCWPGLAGDASRG